MLKQIKAITDNPGYFDRYTVYLKGGGYIGLSHNPDSPQGFSQYGEGAAEPYPGKEITFQELPEKVQDHIIKRLKE